MSVCTGRAHCGSSGGRLGSERAQEIGFEVTGKTMVHMRFRLNPDVQSLRTLIKRRLDSFALKVRGSYKRGLDCLTRCFSLEPYFAHPSNSP